MFNYYFKNFNSVFLTCALTFISIANAQEVRTLDNKETIKKVRKNQVTTSATAPTAPLEGDVWFDTSAPPTQTKIYKNGAESWVTVEADHSVYKGFFIIERPVGSSDTFTIDTIRGLPFQPSQVTFVAHANVDSINSKGSSNRENNITNSFGTMNGFFNASKGVQQVIYVGGNGNSINNIGWFSSSSHCIGVRYGDQNGNDLGIITGALSLITAAGIAIEDGFDITVKYNASNRQATAFRKEKLVILYTAYK
jgi:hypothetical protein